MKPSAFGFIKHQLQAQRENQLWRSRQVIDGCDVYADEQLDTQQQGRFIYHDNKRFLNFCSNDYLALAANKDIKQAACQAITKYGVGSTGSSLISGYTSAHQQLEQQLCDWLGFEACLLFNSGFGANSALLHCLMDDPKRFIVQDKLCHASLISAGLQVKAKMTRFVHNDVASLNLRLSKCHGDSLVVSEGVFSMDGDRAPINDISKVCDQHKAWLMVDDAHGVGVFGKYGEGSIGNIKPDIHMVTFGKALGTSGAAIGGSKALIEYLTQFCKHYVYSTSMPAVIAASTSKSIKLVQGQYGNENRQKLQSLIAYFNHKKQSSVVTKYQGDGQISNSPIQPIIIGDASATMKVSQLLKAHGIWLSGIRPPTVPPNTSRLRVTISSAHEQTDIDRLFDLLESFL